MFYGMWFITLFAVGLIVTSCQQMNHENARQALQIFCSAHRNEIIQSLLTPEQQRAGQIVCSAVGMHLGQ